MTRKQSPDNIPTSTVAEYYRRRAAGGVGLIVTEGSLVDHSLASPHQMMTSQESVPTRSRPSLLVLSPRETRALMV